MSLYLNQIKIPGYEQKIALTLTLAGEDMSGNSSSTQQAEKGDKPKQITVQTLIRFKDEKDLTQLINLAEAKNQADERTIYNVLNNTARAANIRQVRFQGDVQIREEDTIEAWTVNFRLVEYRSIPEKKESRITPAAVVNQQATGEPVIPDSAQTTAAGVVDLTSVEKVLSKVNQLLK